MIKILALEMVLIIALYLILKFLIRAWASENKYDAFVGKYPLWVVALEIIWCVGIITFITTLIVTIILA